jgi:hypothetical protein
MDNIDKAIVAMVAGLWLIGLPTFAGYLAGFYGVVTFTVVMIFSIIG